MVSRRSKFSALSKTDRPGTLGPDRRLSLPRDHAAASLRTRPHQGARRVLRSAPAPLPWAGSPSRGRTARNKASRCSGSERSAGFALQEGVLRKRSIPSSPDSHPRKHWSHRNRGIARDGAFAEDDIAHSTGCMSNAWNHLAFAAKGKPEVRASREAPLFHA